MSFDPGGFDYQIEVLHGGGLVGKQPASLAACLEDALFRQIVSGRHPNDGSVPSCRWAPVWKESPPVVRAVELHLGDGPIEHYDVSVFASQASGCIASIVKQGVVEALADLEWRVTAVPVRADACSKGARVSRSPLPIERGEVPEAGEGELVAEIDRSLLSPLSDAFALAGSVERAWLLYGEVCNDPKRAATIVRVQEAVAVETPEGGASEMHFHFEPMALVRARDAARRWHPNAVGVGWLHTHPGCVACVANPACKVDTRFFSSADIEVHTGAFPSPFMVGIVLGKAADRSVADPAPRAYGWSGARIREIPLWISGEAPEPI